MKKRFFSLLIIIFGATEIFAQGGGPPMITDDPGTPDINCWEFNLSFNSDIRKLEKEFESPLLDINYGLNERTQLKIEIPYLLIKANNTDTKGQFGDLKLGIKYRFLDEDLSPIAFSAYPQIEIDLSGEGSNSYILPVQLEKSFGKLVLGADVGYAYSPENPDYLFNGLLLGFGFTEQFEMMAELNFLIPWEFPDDIETTINLGMRLELSDYCNFLMSVGTGVTSPSSDTKSKLISFMGLQINI